MIFLTCAAILLGAVISIFAVLKRNAGSRKKDGGFKDELEKMINPFGFSYDPGQDVFYSLTECWQREAGYCKLYDDAAIGLGMYIDCEPVKFTYGGKKWLVEFWKGQYGITVGAEIGVYSIPESDSTPIYRAVSDGEMPYFKFEVYKDGKMLFKREGKHWWLTGFRLGEYANPERVTMNLSIDFPENGLCDAFEKAVLKLGYSADEISVHKNRVSLKFSNPRSKQPSARGSIVGEMVRETNKNNCKIFALLTDGKGRTLEKLEYIYNSVPDFFGLFVSSLCPGEMEQKFKSISSAVEGQNAKQGKEG